MPSSVKSFFLCSSDNSCPLLFAYKCLISQLHVKVKKKKNTYLQYCKYLVIKKTNTAVEKGAALSIRTMGKSVLLPATSSVCTKGTLKSILSAPKMQVKERKA